MLAAITILYMFFKGTSSDNSTSYGRKSLCLAVIHRYSSLDVDLPEIMDKKPLHTGAGLYTVPDLNSVPVGCF